MPFAVSRSYARARPCPGSSLRDDPSGAGGLDTPSARANLASAANGQDRFGVFRCTRRAGTSRHDGDAFMASLP